LPTSKFTHICIYTLISGGQVYALPLLASQQCTSALAHLEEAGGGLGFLQATHMGVVMDMVGLFVGDFTLEGGLELRLAAQQHQHNPQKKVTDYGRVHTYSAVLDIAPSFPLFIAGKMG